MAKQWSVTLNTGAKMPAFGLGTAREAPQLVEVVVEAAIKGGYRLFDCAYAYGNEHEIGNALQKCFREGVVKREEVFITSKLWCTSLSKEDVLPGCQQTLKDLQLDYLDLYLIHWPVALKKGTPMIATLPDEPKLGYDPDRVAKAWEGMEELVAKGLVKAIGISNFSITKTEQLLQTAKIVPAVNQVECNPYLQQPKLKEYCDCRGIVMEAYSPLGTPGNPADLNSNDPVACEDSVVCDIAKKHGFTPAQVCLAFSLHRGLVVTPKTANPKRLPENLKSTEIKLDEDDLRKLTEQDKNFRRHDGQMWLKDSELAEEAMWDSEADRKFVIPTK